MKFHKLLIVILALSLTPAVFAQEIKLAPQEVIEDYLDMADNYAFSGDYQKALEYINMVVYFEPMNSTARYKQAMLLTTLNKKDKAKEIFAEAVKLNPEFANTELAKLLNPQKTAQPVQALKPQLREEIIGQPAPKAAVQPVPQENKPVFQPQSDLSIKNDFEETFAGTENSPVLRSSSEPAAPALYSSEYYNELGLKFLNDGDNVKALEYFKKAVELDKKNYEAYNNLGLFYWQHGENKIAEQTFKKALHVNPQFIKPLLNLGLLYKEQEKEDKYFDYISKAIKISPDDYLANWVLGNYYAESGRFHQASRNYKKSIERNPEFYEGYISLGNALAQANRFEEAYAVFEKALTVNSSDPELYYMLSRTASILGKNPDAKHYILEGLELSKTDKFYLELAKVEQNMGDFEEALEVLMQHFADTKEPEILNYIGLAYYKVKQPEIALNYFKKLIAADQSKTTYLYNIALCYKSLGDRKSFFNYVDMATKILPKTPQDYIDLSFIYFDNGNRSFAQNILNEGILKYPNEKKLYLSKLSLLQTCGDTRNYVDFKAIVDSKFGPQ